MEALKIFICEKLKLNNQSQLSNNEKTEYDFYDFIKELESLNTSYGKPKHITSTSGKRKKYSLEEGNCYLYSSSTNRNEILYIYNIMDVRDENTGNIRHICIIITKYPSRAQDNDKGLIVIHAAIMYDNCIINTILQTIRGEKTLSFSPCFFHIINMEQFLKDFKTFVDLLMQNVPIAKNYEKSIKTELTKFNKYLLNPKKLNSPLYKDLNKDLIKFYKV